MDNNTLVGLLLIGWFVIIITEKVANAINKWKITKTAFENGYVQQIVEDEVIWTKPQKETT